MRLPAVALLVVLAAAQQPVVSSGTLATLAGAGAALSGPAATLDAHRQLEVSSGATISATAAGAELDLRRGGRIQLCGPARLGLNRGGGNALLLSLQAGAVNLRYAAPVADALLTPDFRVSTVIPPGQEATVSANLALTAQGSLCLSNHGSALSLQRLWDGSQQFVVAGETIEIDPGGSQKDVAACPCASPPPIAVPSDVAAGAAAGALFPGQPALSVNGGNAPPPPYANSPAPPLRPHHRNPFSRFFHWLFG